MRRVLMTVVLALLTVAMQAQEFQCSMSVQSASVQGTNKQIYENMRNALNDFMRAQIWTNDKFDSKERIECSFNFNITEQISSNEFKGVLTVQLRRPVYGSAYTTTMFNMQDNDVQFKYNEGQPLTFNESSYDSDNLVPLIAFYAYFMLGLDYDSFSPDGGSEYFKKAETIVNQAQSAQYAGWKSYEGTKNRYWLINNVLDDNHKLFRQMLYKYHRQGLDAMTDNVEQGRTAIYECMEDMEKVKQRASRNAYLLGLFFTAKADELVGIFSESPAIEKEKIVEILSSADPGNISKYQKINDKK